MTDQKTTGGQQGHLDQKPSPLQKDKSQAQSPKESPHGKDCGC